MAEYGYYVVPSSPERDLGQRLILVNNICVRPSDMVKTRNKAKKMTVTQHLRGTLLREFLLARDSPLDRNKILCKHAEIGSIFECLRDDVEEIGEGVFDLLLAITSCRERFEIFQDQERLAEGLEMDQGIEVFVKIPNTSGEVEGIIRYKGFIVGKHGTHFGVELFDTDGRGDNNGTYGKHKYFQCRTDCGIFLPLNRVRPVRKPRRSKQNKMPSGRNKQETCPNTLNISEEELNRLGISHGMQVYIFTEVRGQESQEKGRVKFIGRLPGTKSSEIYVGIDLDKPVGNGTGLYSGKHLFYTKQNHAALVPLSGVLPAYINDMSQTNELTNERNHVYEDLDDPEPSTSTSTVRRPFREHNGRQHMDFNSDISHPMIPSYVKQSNRNTHSSPSILGMVNNRLEEPEANLNRRHANGKISPRQRHSPMDVQYHSNTEERRNSSHLYRLEDSPRKMVSEERRNSQHLYRPDDSPRKMYPGSSRGSRSSAFRRLQRQNSGENNSEDELTSQLDLYGSGEEASSRKSDNRMELYSSRQDNTTNNRTSSPTMSKVLRPRTANSMPGVATTKSRSPVAARSSATAPVALSRRPMREEILQPPIAELVPYNSISNTEIHNSTRDHAEMEVGTMVEVMEGISNLAVMGPAYGVIKWIGALPDQKETVAGIEFDSPVPGGTDGTFSGVRYFNCELGRGWFVFLKFCKKDPRFSSPEIGATAGPLVTQSISRDFGSFESPRIPGAVPSPHELTENMVGKRRGIQGHHNSCYLDSTLFSLFAYSQVLDTILFRKKKPTDLPEYEETQTVLREYIINPLRRNNFVRADRIMKLRELLDRLGSVTGLVSEEKDPEEFLNTLLVQVFKAEPLIELRQGDSNAAHEGYFYQIFMEKDEKMGIPSTQQLLMKSVISADLKFRNVPVCLILQMPRFGKDYKMYKKLRPSLTLDVTDFVEDIPRTCDICEGVAEYECRDCYLEGSLNEPVFSYCRQCADRVHSHRKRNKHCYRAIKLPDEFRDHWEMKRRNNEEVNVERQHLELFAVVCIATSHYVSFAKCGYGKNSTWCFFDSMADRVGEQSGYNIPEITHCPEVEAWLQWDEKKINEMDERTMPELMRRLLCDAYMCMYQCTDLMFNK